MSSKTDINSEKIVLSKADKHKKKISEFKDLLLKEFLLLTKDDLLISFQEFFKNIEKCTPWGLTIKGIAERNLTTSAELKDIKDKSFLKTSVFLVFFEGIYLAYVNAICQLLITNGHDLYNTYTKKYCDTLNDIEGLDTCSKFEFLKIHGFGFIVRNDDRHLRNKIAHLKYSIVDEDRIKIDRDNINIRERSLDLFTFVMALNSKICEVLEFIRIEQADRTK